MEDPVSRQAVHPNFHRQSRCLFFLVRENARDFVLAIRLNSVDVTHVQIRRFNHGRQILQNIRRVGSQVIVVQDSLGNHVRLQDHNTTRRCKGTRTNFLRLIHRVRRLFRQEHSRAKGASRIKLFFGYLFCGRIYQGRRSRVSRLVVVTDRSSQGGVLSGIVRIAFRYHGRGLSYLDEVKESLFYLSHQLRSNSYLFRHANDLSGLQ